MRLFISKELLARYLTRSFLEYVRGAERRRVFGYSLIVRRVI